MIRPLLSGAALGAPWVFAFSPFGHWWLGLLLLACLPILSTRLFQANRGWSPAMFLCGLGFGWAAYGVGVAWLHISLHTYGGLPSWFAWVSVCLFALYLALFPALALVVYGRFRSQSESPIHVLVNALLWSALWTFFEWARGTFMTGFAWLGLGDTFVDSPFNAMLPWLGSHGTLFVLMLLGHLLFGLARSRSLGLAVPVVVVGLVVALLLQAPTNTRSTPVLSVAGVQTNVDQSIKFDPDLIVSNMEKAFALGDMAKTALGQAGLIMFPETVNPLVWTDTPQAWRLRFRDFATPGGTPVILGSAIQEGTEYFNSIVMFNGDESEEALTVPLTRHDKRHLVPFGEFIPLGFKWFVAMLNMPMGEFTPGSGPLSPFEVGENFLASTVCYEDTFSGEFAGLLRNAQQEPTMLLNLSNLAWFGQTRALDQHAQMGRTRSAEHRKPSLRVTNTGLSGIVDERGQWVKLARAGHAVVWSGEIEGRLGQTFFAKWGSSIWFVLWGVVLLLCGVREWRIRAYNRAHSFKTESTHSHVN